MQNVILCASHTKVNGDDVNLMGETGTGSPMLPCGLASYLPSLAWLIYLENGINMSSYHCLSGDDEEYRRPRLSSAEQPRPWHSAGTPSTHWAVLCDKHRK